MSKFYRHSPKIELIPKTENGDILRLAEDFAVKWYGVEFTIPAGFECDGASVPRCLWGSVSPQISPETLAGAIAHDYIYRVQPEGWTRYAADCMFRDMIREDGFSWWKTQKAYYGVRWFGGMAWENNKK